MPIRSDKPGYVRVKDRIPYAGKGFEELLTALKQVFADPANKFTQKVVLDVTEPFIYLEKMVTEIEAQETPQLSLHDIIRNQKMEEYLPEKEQPGINHLWDIFALIHQEGLEVGFLVVGNKPNFQRWLGVRIPTKDMRVFGVPLKVVDGIPEDVFVVCGTESRVAEPDDIRYCVKGNLP